MAKIKDLTMQEMELFIEQKVLEMAEDLDFGLKLKPSSEKELQKRLKKKSKRVSHVDVKCHLQSLRKSISP